MPRTFSRVSRGRVLITPKASFLNYWFTGPYTQSVPAPVSLTTSLFLFDFEREIDKQAVFMNRSKASIERVSKLVGAAMGNVPEEEIRGYIKSMGVSDEVVDTAVKNVKDGILTALSKSSLSQLVVKDLLDSQASINLLSDITQPNFQQISDAVASIQNLYAKFCMSEPLADVSTYISSHLFTNPVVRLARSLHVMFSQTPGPTTLVRASYIHEQIYKGIWGTEPINMRAIIPGRVYETTGVNQVQDLSFSEAISGMMLGLRTIMGLPSQAGSLTLPISDFVQQSVTGIGELQPFLPAELSTDTLEFTQEQFTKIWLHFLVQRVIQNDEGLLAGRFTNVIDARKYGRDDSVDRSIREAVSVSSILFSAFLDASAYFTNLAKSKDFWWTSIHPTKRERLSEFVFKFLGQFNTFRTGATHPRFLNEAAHVINHDTTLGRETFVPDFIVSDPARRSATDFFVDVKDFSYSQYLKSRLISGSILDAPIDVDIRLLSLTRIQDPIYAFEVPIPEIISSSEALQLSTRFLAIDKLVNRTAISEHILNRSEIVYFADAKELALRLSIPYDLAVGQIGEQGGTFVDFGLSRTMLVFWNPDVAPVYEENTVDPSMFVAPFIAQYPYLVTSNISSTGTINPSMFKSDSASYKNPPTPKPDRGNEDPAPNDDDTSHADAEPQPAGDENPSTE